MMNGFKPLENWNRFIRDVTLVYGSVPSAFYNYYANIHPKTERQYYAQSWLRGVSPWYDSWMVNRSLDERNRNTRQYYNVQFSDITYPHLSGILSGNTIKQYGSTAWTFSKNLSRLYK